MPTRERRHDRFRLLLIDEPEVSSELREQAGRLLFSVFGHAYVLGRGWHKLEPLYRVMAFDGDDLVGNRMTWLVGSPHGLVLFGFGDMGVREDMREFGIARAMTEWAVEEAVSRGAELMMTSTEDMAAVYRSLGFHNTRPGDYVCPTKPRDSNLWVRWQQPPLTLPVFYDSEF